MIECRSGGLKKRGDLEIWISGSVSDVSVAMLGSSKCVANDTVFDDERVEVEGRAPREEKEIWWVTTEIVSSKEEGASKTGEMHQKVNIKISRSKKEIEKWTSPSQFTKEPDRARYRFFPSLFGASPCCFCTHTSIHQDQQRLAISGLLKSSNPHSIECTGGIESFFLDSFRPSARDT